LDSKGEKTADFRVLGPFVATGPRLLNVNAVSWFNNDVADLPSQAFFMAVIEVFEEARLMPSPDNNKIKFTATAPTTDAPGTLVISGPPKTATTFETVLRIQYP